MNMASQITTLLASLFSPHMLYLAVAGILLLRKEISDRLFGPLVFLFSALYFQLFYGQHIHISSIGGDNLCQIAYWNILFRPELVGSIGASFTKPGHLILLGLLHESTRLFGEMSFQLGLSLVMAWCVWILVIIATDLGGREAGLVAFLAATAALLFEFAGGSFSIPLIASTFTGLWLYYYRPDHKSLGRFFLVLSIHFHIETVTVLATIWLILLIRKEWRECALFSICSAASLSLWVLIILRVQGTFDRLSSNGVTVGYLGPYSEHLVYSNKLEYLVKVIGQELANNYSTSILFTLAVIGVAGVWHFGGRYYLAVLSVFILLIVNVLALSGGLTLGRHMAVIYGFSCAAGVGSLILVFKKLKCHLGIAYRPATICALLPVLAMFGYMTAFRLHELLIAKPQRFVEDARALMADSNLPNSARIMTEDDLLYPIVIIAPDRYKTLTALQRFNTATELQRKELLKKVDYIWIATNSGQEFYYLDYLAEPAWNSDPFRVMVRQIMKTGQPYTLYGYRFTPVNLNADRLIIKASAIVTHLQTLATPAREAARHG